MKNKKMLSAITLCALMFMSVTCFAQGLYNPTGTKALRTAQATEQDVECTITEINIKDIMHHRDAIYNSTISK
jgi:hypothetical protein